MNSDSLYLITTPINDAMLTWAQRQYPYHLQNFRSLKRQQSYLLGRALLEHSLRYFYHYDEPLILDAAEQGKPYLIAPENNHSIIQMPQFNLSHSHDEIALLLGSPKQTLGVDIENIRERRNFKGLLERTFTNIEIQWINAQANFKEAFFSLWSAKEAYLKADGRGLAGLNSLSFDPEHKIINGTLNNGILLIAINNQQSLAIYIDTLINQQDALKTYRLNNEGLYHQHSIHWKLKLSDRN